MVAGSRRRVAAARVGGKLQRPEQPGEPGRLREALARPSWTPGAPSPQLAVIAEVKRRSPSKGDIAPELDAVAQARAYEAAGADAISVLTEPTRFGGSLDDLRAVAAAVELPVLRKDFIVDKGQIWEAAEAGAAAVLLIVAILSDDRLHELLIEALDCGLDPLVEVHDLDETRRACRAGCTLVGINNRDLVTLEVDIATTEYLAPALGPCMFPVSESGISTLGRRLPRGALGRPRAARRRDARARAARGAPAGHRRPQGPGVAGVTLVKVCGLTRAEDARLAAELGAWALGFVLTESPRRIGAAEAAELIAAATRPDCGAPGRRARAHAARRRRGDHRAGRTGSPRRSPRAAPTRCSSRPAPTARPWRRSGRRPRACGGGRSSSPPPTRRTRRSPTSSCSTRAPTGAYGGTGETLDWRALAADPATPAGDVVLAGGLRPDNVGAAIAALHPAAVDLSSGVESAPGVKDHQRLRDFFAAVVQADGGAATRRITG